MNDREDLHFTEQALGRARRLEHSGLLNLAEDVLRKAIGDVHEGGTAHNSLVIRLTQLNITLRDPAHAWVTLQLANQDSDTCRLTMEEIESLLGETCPSDIEEHLATLRSDDAAAIRNARLKLKTLLSVRLSHLRSAHAWRRPWLEAWLAIQPNDSFAKWQLSRAIYSLDCFDTAESLLLELSECFPDRRGILNLLGRSQFKNDKKSAAIETWQKSLAIDSEQPAIHFALGRALLQAACTE